MPKNKQKEEQSSLLRYCTDCETKRNVCSPRWFDAVNDACGVLVPLGVHSTERCENVAVRIKLQDREPIERVELLGDEFQRMLQQLDLLARHRCTSVDDADEIERRSFGVVDDAGWCLDRHDAIDLGRLRKMHVLLLERKRDVERHAFDRSRFAHRASLRRRRRVDLFVRRHTHQALRCDEGGVRTSCGRRARRRRRNRWWWTMNRNCGCVHYWWRWTNRRWNGMSCNRHAKHRRWYES